MEFLERCAPFRVQEADASKVQGANAHTCGSCRQASEELRLNQTAFYIPPSIFGSSAKVN